MAVLLARTRDEAQLYMDLHPCERCGSVDVPWASALVSVDGELARGYSGACAGCGLEREFVFRLPETGSMTGSAPASADGVVFGGPGPSELLDAGEWLWVADLVAGNIPADDPASARQALGIAAAAMDEILKFVPAGADEVPDAAFWSRRGRRVRAEEPGRFQRDRLAIVRDSYRDQLAAVATSETGDPGETGDTVGTGDPGETGDALDAGTSGPGRP